MKRKRVELGQVRHGAALGLGEVVVSLEACGTQLPAQEAQQVAGLVRAVERARLYRGKGGELMRGAISRCPHISAVPHFQTCTAKDVVTLGDIVQYLILHVLCVYLLGLAAESGSYGTWRG